MKTFKIGDRVRIHYQDRTIDGEIALVSENGKSLLLTFDAMLAGYGMMMPVLYDGFVFREVVNRDRIDIFPRTHDIINPRNPRS